jgi:hypothetical protein
MDCACSSSTVPATRPTPKENLVSTTQPYGQPSYEPQPYGTPYAPVATDPGRTLGIVGLVLSFLAAAVGLVVSIVALRKSKRAGFKNGFALAGIVVGGVVTVLWVVGIAVGGIALGGVAAKCAELGPGTHTVDGVTYTCS